MSKLGWGIFWMIHWIVVPVGSYALIIAAFWGIVWWEPLRQFWGVEIAAAPSLGEVLPRLVGPFVWWCFAYAAMDWILGRAYTEKGVS